MRNIKLLAEDVTVRIHVALANGSTGNGTGFVVSATPEVTYILTNRHVLRDASIPDSYIYYPITNQYARFEVVDCQENGPDLAIIVTRLKLNNIPSISWRKRLTKDEPVFTFGFPAGHPSFSVGSFIRRNNDHNTWEQFRNESKWSEMCDLATSHSASGSAVFDSYGDVVGVVSKGMPGLKDVTYIVPIPHVRKMLRCNGIQFLGLGETDNGDSSIDLPIRDISTLRPFRPEEHRRNLPRPRTVPHDYERARHGSHGKRSPRNRGKDEHWEAKLICSVM